MKSINLRATAIVAVTAAVFSITTPAYAFFGGSSGVAKEVTQLASWAAQYAQKVKELKQLKQHYDSVSGARMMADLVNNPEIRKYLPPEFEDLWRGTFEDSDELLQILLSLPEFDTNQLYEKRLKQLAIDDAMSRKAYKEANRRFEDIQLLLDKINEMHDDKEIQDLMARIEAEQVMLQGEVARLTVMYKQQEIEEKKNIMQINQRIGNNGKDNPNNPFYGVTLQ